jgi:SAM-dependent methyltransferase
VRGYQQDLAYIHDRGFTGFIRRAAPGLLSLLRRNGVRGGLVVDAGCGSGVWARALTGAGYRVLGMDISPAMIRLARRQAPEAAFRVGSLVSAALPPCDAITSIGECVNYAFERGSGRPGLCRFLRRSFKALRPGGVLIFDIVEPGVVNGGQPKRKFVEGPDWAILLEVREDARRHRLTRRITSFRQAGKLYRRSREIHRLHLYPRAEVLADLTAAGFEARMLAGYGRFRFPPSHAAFVARKPRNRLLS